MGRGISILVSFSFQEYKPTCAKKIDMYAWFMSFWYGLTNKKPSRWNSNGRVSVYFHWCFTTFCAKLRIESKDFEHLKCNEFLKPIMKLLVEGVDNCGTPTKTAEDCSVDLKKWLDESEGGKFTSVGL